MPFTDELKRFLEQGGIRGALGLEPDTELKAGTVLPISSLGQSTFQLLMAPVISELGDYAGGKLQEYIESDEEFKQFQKQNPELASKALTLAGSTPTALAGFLAAMRGLNRSAGGVVERGVNRPGQAAELMKKMKDTSTESLIDDLLKVQKRGPLPDLPPTKPYDPKNAKDALEILMRR